MAERIYTMNNGDVSRRVRHGLALTCRRCEIPLGKGDKVVTKHNTGRNGSNSIYCYACAETVHLVAVAAVVEETAD